MNGPYQYIYVGMSRAGIAQTGKTTDAPSLVAQRLFDRGYQWLRITDRSGLEVGGITLHPDTRQRTWWGEL